MKKQLLTILPMVLLTLAATAQEISADFPFESHYQKLGENNIHYIDEGTGDPILFLHGIPMSSYSWRNVIPQISDSARCIAIDFMGFGKSDKPNIEYSFIAQYNYLASFIDSLNLTNLTLVMTDIGGILGTKYALENPSNIKGLVYMETPFGDSRTFHKNGGMMQHMMFWMGRQEKLGYHMIVKKNMFIKMMGMLIKRKLTNEEKKHYREPFLKEEWRTPLFTLPNSFPKKGKNPQNNDMADMINKNNAFLTRTTIPKLVLYAKPGMLVNKKAVKWINNNIPTTETKLIGQAKHLMEEDLPIEIGRTINNWYLNLKD